MQRARIEYTHPSPYYTSLANACSADSVVLVHAVVDAGVSHLQTMGLLVRRNRSDALGVSVGVSIHRR
jgi:hypothetical protein